MRREICARSAGPGLRPGAAEHPSLLEHHGLSIGLLGARQPDAARHVDHQSGSEIGHSGPGAQVSHIYVFRRTVHVNARTDERYVSRASAYFSANFHVSRDVVVA